jgi:hypothetical protein
MQKTVSRLASLCVMVSLVVLTALMVHGTGQSVAAASTITIHPVADAYVYASSPATNFGKIGSLRVDGNPVKHTYLRFTVSGLGSAAIQLATLRIYADSANSAGLSVSALSNNNWTETTLTYANAPACGNVIGNSSKFSAGTWVQVDVTSYIKSAGTFNLMLGSLNSTNTILASREDTAGHAPQLVLTLASPATATHTKTISATATLVKTLVPTSTTTKMITPSATSTNAPAPSSTPIIPAGWEPTFPIRAAFYYPWFPEAWKQKGIYPYTNYTPTLGYYSSSDLNIIKQHIAMMQYGNIQVGISSWWGQGTPTDGRVAQELSAAAGTKFRWALYYEMEGSGDPSVSQIKSDLAYILNHYGNDPSYLRVNGKFVVFAYSDTQDACGMADRWKQANTVGAYVVLKVFPGYANCASQPDSWHQYSPAVAADHQGNLSYSISPGFWLAGTPMRLARNITRWSQNVRDMVASGANWQLVTTFSEWGEGTAVEPATQWSSPSGYGQYLDALHTNGN